MNHGELNNRQSNNHEKVLFEIDKIKQEMKVNKHKI